MAIQLVDGNGLPIFSDVASLSQNLAAANAAVTLTLSGQEGFQFQVTGTYVGTLVIEGTVDNTNWVAVQCFPSTATGLGAAVSTLASAATGLWAGVCASFTSLRVRMSAYTSGTAVVSVRASQGDLMMYGYTQGMVAGATTTSGNPVKTGGVFNTTTPTYTTGQQTEIQTTARGEQLVALSSGATAVGVKAASTAAVAADPGLVVSLSPNLPVSTTYNVNSAATTNAASVKASAGTVYGIACSNSGAAAAFVKLYNLAAAPTVGTSIPFITIAVPATGSVFVEWGLLGIRLATGISVAITNLSTDADATAVTAGQVKITMSYI